VKRARAGTSALAVAAAVVAVSLAGAGPASAQTSTSTTSTPTSTTTTVVAPPACSASFSPDPASVDRPISVRVTGFEPGEPVAVTAEDFPLGSVPADSSGVLAESVGPLPSAVTALVPPFSVSVGFSFTGERSGATCTATLALFHTATPTTAATAAAPAAAAVQATPSFTG